MPVAHRQQQRGFFFLCLSGTGSLLAQKQEHLIGTPQREAMFAIVYQ